MRTTMCSVFVIVALVAVAAGLELDLYRIEERFKASKVNRSQLVLPSISKELSLQEEINEYGQLHQDERFKMFKADPELSCKILLRKDGSSTQSIFVKGKELSELLLEITIIHKGDDYNHQKDSINLYLINYETSEVLIAEKVKHLRLFKADVVSDLYELVVAYDWANEKRPEVNTTEEVTKHIVLNIDIVPARNDEGKPQKDDAVTTAEKIKAIKGETDRIFMSSLDIWEQIGKHHTEHYANQEQVYLRAYFQLVLIFCVNCVELLILRRTLKLRSLI